MMYDRLLLTAVLVPLLPSVVIGMAACFWLSARRSLRRRKISGEKIMLDAGDSQTHSKGQSAPSNTAAAASPTGTTITTTTSNTRRRRGRLWPLERKGKVSLQDVTADDIKGLSKEECLCLFRLLRPATLQQLHGEWQGEILAMGMFYPLAYLVWHWRLGRGWWLGKGVDEESKQGYNTFYNHGATSRSRRFEVLLGPSAYGWEEEEEEEEEKEGRKEDGEGHRESKTGAYEGVGASFRKRKGSHARHVAEKEEEEAKSKGASSNRIEGGEGGEEHKKDRAASTGVSGRKSSSSCKSSCSGESLHFVYARYNDGLFRRMHEEVRCVHDGLFLGFGSLGGVRGRTPLNSIPFLLVAPKSPLKPWDRERN